MNKTIDYLILFGSGLLLGIFGTKKYWESKYKTLAEEEIASVKEVYGVKNDKKVDEEVEIEPEPTKNSYEMVTDLYKISPVEENIVDYGKYYDNTERSEPDTQVKVVEKLAEKEFPRENDPPKFISEEEFCDTEPGFDKMSCTLYVPNRVVVDDTSREVVDDQLIGEENMEYICTNLPKLVYIRNETIGCDMEIEVITDSIEDLDAMVYFN